MSWDRAEELRQLEALREQNRRYRGALERLAETGYVHPSDVKKIARAALLTSGRTTGTARQRANTRIAEL